MRAADLYPPGTTDRDFEDEPQDEPLTIALDEQGFSHEVPQWEVDAALDEEVA